MENLNNSTFFDERLLKYIQKLLYSQQKITPINNTETLLLNKQNDLKELNNQLNHTLIETLDSVKSYLRVGDAALFLLDAQKINQLDDATEALEYIVREERMLTYEQLKELLDNSNEVPLSWAIVLIGEDIDNRYENKKPIQKSGLDMDRLRNFK